MSTITTNKLVSDSPKGEILEIEDEVERQFRCFSNFDIDVAPPYDHYYLDQDPDASSSYSFCIKNIWSASSKNDAVRRKNIIFKEWELLRTSLPNSIFVRAYSSRLELMRAAVIGLRDDKNNSKSPYSYGLFFFDIMLPSQYPAKPPQITCLFNNVALDVSRLASEAPNQNVLQSLKLIQEGMAAKGRLVKEEKRNELFVLSHKAMHNTLRDPPQGFQDLVNGYFRKFSHVILMQLKEYLENRDYKKNNGGERVYNMEKLTFHQLFSDFEENGSYCRHIKLDFKKID